MDLQLFPQFFLPGLTAGCIYALVAMGFVLCSNVSGVINFAQGELVMIGGLIAISLAGMGVPLPVMLVGVAAAGALIGVLQERLTLAPVRESPAFVQITITLGVSVVIRGISLIIWGKDPLSMPGFSGDDIFMLFDAVLPVQTLWVWGTTVVMLAAVFWFLKYTSIGRAVRACATNQTAARLMGIDVERMTILVFAAAGAAGAVGGAVIVPIVLGRYDAGLEYGLKGFIGAIIGGFRNPGLAALGGLGIGIVEALAVGYVSSAAKDALAYGLLLAYLLVRGGVFAFGRSALLTRTE
jgi:branched-subunit amino acid ABC-type transport system permease component